MLVEMPQDGKPLSQEHVKAWVRSVVVMSSSTTGFEQCAAPMSRWCVHGPPWLAWSGDAHAVAAGNIRRTPKLGGGQDTRCIDDNGWSVLQREISGVEQVF